MNIRFEAKDAPFIRTSRTKKTLSENSTIFPPILGVKWGGGMEKCGNKALMLEFLDRYGKNLNHIVVPT
jgi:hypothetical protein